MIGRRIQGVAARLAVAFGLGIAGSALAGASVTVAQEFTMKLAHVVAPGSPRDKLLTTYAANLEKRTGGRIKATVYPSGQLGSNRQVLEGLQLGTIEGTVNPTSFQGGFQQLLSIFDIPFLFNDGETLVKVANGPIGKELLGEVESIGLKGLAFYLYGPRNFVTKFPIHTAADLKGRKLRVISSPMNIETFQAWGTNPVPVPFGETYNALAQGVVEGQENSWDLVRDMKFYEVSPYLTESTHGHWVDIFTVSKVWYDTLPPDLQEAVVEEAQALIPERLQWGREYIDAALAELQTKKGVEYRRLAEKERDAMRPAAEAARAIYLKNTGERGQYYLNKFAEAVKMTNN